MFTNVGFLTARAQRKTVRCLLKSAEFKSKFPKSSKPLSLVFKDSYHFQIRVLDLFIFVVSFAFSKIEGS